jgi:hypothetical protein
VGIRKWSYKHFLLGTGVQPRGRHSRLSLSVPLWNVPWPKEWNWCARADLHFKQRAQAGRVIVYGFLTKTLTFPQSSQARKRPSSSSESFIKDLCTDRTRRLRSCIGFSQVGPGATLPVPYQSTDRFWEKESQ